MVRLLVRDCLGVEFEQGGPAARTTDDLAHGVRPVAHALEIAVLQIDPSAIALCCEQHLNLGDEVRIVGKFGRELPDQHQPGRRIPYPDLADVTLRAVDSQLVPASIVLRLQHRPFEVGRADLVRLGPPAPDAAGEDVEGAVLRGVDEDALAHRGRSNLGTHLCSSLDARSTSSAKADSAESQNWSSQARMAPSPFGSMW